VPNPSGVDSLVPKLNVLIKGNRLPMETVGDLLSVTVSEDLDIPAMFTLELVNWNLVKSQITWADSDCSRLGIRSKFKWGTGTL
jgi:hypothetical protein